MHLRGGGRGGALGREGAHGEGRSLPERCRAPQVGETPLYLAVEGGHATVAGQLLAAGAAVTARDEVGGWRRHG